jgi:xanthosine utilization system XapX-like protein
MDVKKLAGMLIAFSLAVLIIRTAAPGTLAVIDVGLIGLLYVIRSQRTPEKTSTRIRKALFEAVSVGATASRPAAPNAHHRSVSRRRGNF